MWGLSCHCNIGGHNIFRKGCYNVKTPSSTLMEYTVWAFSLLWCSLGITWLKTIYLRLKVYHWQTVANPLGISNLSQCEERLQDYSHMAQGKKTISWSIVHNRKDLLWDSQGYVITFTFCSAVTKLTLLCNLFSIMFTYEIEIFFVHNWYHYKQC